MRTRRAIAQYEATVILVVVSLALAAVVYAGLRRGDGLETQPLFVNGVTPIGGSPLIERVDVNASSQTALTSLSLDAASSSSGILALSASSYSTTDSLCAAGETTFFSVFAPEAGSLTVTTNGDAWVSGVWGDAAAVSAGWQEVMIANATTCSVTLPGGAPVPTRWSAGSTVLSSLPIEGPPSGTTFTFYLPTGDHTHSLLITSSGGFDQIAV